VLVVDAAHTAQPIFDAVGDRTVVAVLCTHAHNDHVIVAPELAERFDAPILLHPGDEVLWKQTHPPVDYSALADDQRITVAGIEVRVIHTPGHSPGSVCLYAPALGAVCSGDTLSGVAPAQRAGPIRTSRRSSTRSAPGCSPCRRRRLCTPGTATTPRSAPRRRTLRTGSPTAAELPNGRRQLSWQMGGGS